MRVLIVSHGHPSFSIGGAEVASHNLFRGLSVLPGLDVFYLARAPTSIGRHASTPLMSLGHGFNETFMHATAWDEFWLSNENLSDLREAFATYLSHTRPDIVHFHHVIGFGVESVALVRRLVPTARIIITFHEYLTICAHHGQMVKSHGQQLCRGSSPAACSLCLPDRDELDFFARQQHLKAHLLLADEYISPSRFLRDRYIAWGLPASRFSVIENGIDGSPVPPRKAGENGPRNRFGFFGQISQFKGLHVLLDATMRVPEEIWGTASLSIFGGNLEQQPESFRSRFELLLDRAGRRAKFYGSYTQRELASLMSDVDWVIVPSIWWENSPVVIQEAFLHRRPLIVSGIGGMAEKVRDGIDGLHFRVASAESLADQLSLALTDTALWTRLAAAAPLLAGLETFASQHLAAYERNGSGQSVDALALTAA